MSDLNQWVGTALAYTEHMLMSQILMMVALPVVILMAITEWACLRGDNKFELKDSLSSSVMGAGYIFLAEGFAVFFVVIPVFEWVYQYRLMTVEGSVVSVIVLVVLVDFLFYVFHLTAHKVRFLWAIHEVHHASECFNYTVAFRQSILYAFFGAYLFFLPAVLLGFQTEYVLTALAANLLIQVWVHTQAIGRLPAFVEWLFNTPSNHRVHHARNDRYIDRNLGGVLMIWDHLFGTYAAEEESEPPQYGVVSQKGKSVIYNPILLTFRESMRIIRDVSKPGPLRDRLHHLWGTPEWRRPIPSDPSCEEGS